MAAASATAARFSASTAIARATDDESPAMVAARARDWSGLADELLRPAGFSQPTITALEELGAGASTRPGEAALAVALASPDLLVA